MEKWRIVSNLAEVFQMYLTGEVLVFCSLEIVGWRDSEDVCVGGTIKE